MHHPRALGAGCRNRDVHFTFWGPPNPKFETRARFNTCTFGKPNGDLRAIKHVASSVAVTPDQLQGA